MLPGLSSPRRDARGSSCLLAASALLVAVVLAQPGRAAGEPGTGCPPETEAWAARCAQDVGLAVTPRACPPRRALFAVGAPGDALRIEVTSAAGGGAGFERVGAYWVSPVGEFPDWRAAPAPLRDAFARFRGCVLR